MQQFKLVNAALEDLFSFASSQGRKDLVDAYHKALGSRFEQKIVVARKMHICCKCKNKIMIKDKYLCQTNKADIYLTKHICLKCFGHIEKIKKSKFNFILRN